MNKKRTSVFSNGLIWFGAGVSLAEILTGTYFAPLGIGKAMAMMAMEALKKEGINKVNLVAFTSNELGNGFWKNMGWTFRKDMNYYEFDLNPENVTVFNP